MHLQQAPDQINNEVQLKLAADQPSRINRQNIMMQRRTETGNTFWIGAEPGMVLLTPGIKPGQVQAVRSDRILCTPEGSQTEKMESALGRLTLVSNTSTKEQQILAQGRQGTILVKLDEGDTLEAASDSLLVMAPDLGRKAITEMATHPGAYTTLQPGTYLLEPAG